ncbi:response regulator [Thiohalocapsa sp. ML1]|jgi:DNA-binding response OmpR family regulator|uniref:response regulator n=1 Tax=Thiohalocapsa sp. ML1 TaxID=1431688 RepID=UPI0007320AEC|nr:response regulator [Thiohalocapsa sp. ML1]
MRILVAEDNHILATILADYLIGRGHEVVAAYDGRLAAVFCRQREFDAVVIDLVMPDVYGVDVLEELHAQQRMPHAIVISGFPELVDEMAPRLAAVGVDAVILKPFSFSEVDEALARLH